MKKALKIIGIVIAIVLLLCFIVLLADKWLENALRESEKERTVRAVREMVL